MSNLFIDRKKYYGFIYVTVNKINGKKYIGQHTKWNENYLGSGVYLNRSINKYGKENFQRYIIDLAKTQEELNEKETWYINEGFSLNVAKSSNWYNIKDGSQSGGNVMAGWTKERKEEYGKLRSRISEGRTLTEEHKRNISESISGEKHPCYGKRGEKSPRYGKKHSEETKRKMSENSSSRRPEVRKKISESNKGKVMSIEARRKMSLAASKREKGSMYGKKHSEEAKKKMSEAAKGKEKSIETRKKLSKASSKAIVIFKDGKFYGEFPSILEFGKTMGAKYNNDSIVNAAQALVKGWVPTKRSRWYGWSGMFKEEYEKQQQISS